MEAVKLSKNLYITNRNIILFPHAGALSTFYMKFARAFETTHNIYLINFSECLNLIPDSFSDLIAAISKKIKKVINDEAIFFGHSMGAILAYECACYLQDYVLSIKKLIVSAQVAPKYIHQHLFFNITDDDTVLMQKLATLGEFNIHHEFNSELLAFVLTKLRTDITIMTNYKPSVAAKYDGALYCIRPQEDYPEEHDYYSDWKNYTSQNFHLINIEGRHFSIFDQLELLKPMFFDRERL